MKTELYNKEISIEGLHNCAQELFHLIASSPDKATVVRFNGDLGVGKTTLISEFAHVLGVSEDVSSPTFVILKNYPIDDGDFTNLIHIDAYRLHDASELLKLKFDSYLSNPESLICVEWPQNVLGALPIEGYDITLEITGEASRRIIMTHTESQ